MQRKYRLLPKYERVCFDRDVALRNRGSELGGIGHPLVDALLEETRSPTLTGEVAELGANGLFARYLVRRRDDRGLIQSRVITMLYDFFTGQVQTLQHFPTDEGEGAENSLADLGPARAAIESNLEVEINNWLPSRQSRIGLNISLVGLHQ